MGDSNNAKKVEFLSYINQTNILLKDEEASQKDIHSSGERWSIFWALHRHKPFVKSSPYQ